MGKFLFDQYTYLHFATGVIVYFFGIRLPVWILIHSSFELAENTVPGMKFINTHFYFWPGGKPKADSHINMLGDTIGAILGWLSAYYLDEMGKRFGWYEKHIRS